MRARDFKKRMVIAVGAGFISALAVYLSINQLNVRLEKQNNVIQSLTQELQKAQTVDSLLSSKQTNVFQYVVANTKILRGQKITPDMLQLKQFEYQETGAFDNKNYLESKIAKNDIETGSIVMGSDLTSLDASGFNLERGMRAINISVNNLDGLASYIKSGARVDVASTQKQLQNDRIILQNVEILSVESVNSVSGSTPSLKDITSIILKVPAGSVSKLVDGMIEGKLILLARSANDNAGATTVKKRRYRRYARPYIPANIGMDFGALPGVNLPAPSVPQEKAPAQSLELIQANSKSQVTFEGQ